MEISDSSLYSTQTALIQLKYLANQQIKVYAFEDLSLKHNSILSFRYTFFSVWYFNYNAKHRWIVLENHLFMVVVHPLLHYISIIKIDGCLMEACVMHVCCVTKMYHTYQKTWYMKYVTWYLKFGGRTVAFWGIITWHSNPIMDIFTLQILSVDTHFHLMEGYPCRNLYVCIIL